MSLQERTQRDHHTKTSGETALYARRGEASGGAHPADTLISGSAPPGPRGITFLRGSPSWVYAVWRLQDTDTDLTPEHTLQPLHPQAGPCPRQTHQEGAAHPQLGQVSPWVGSPRTAQSVKSYLRQCSCGQLPILPRTANSTGVGAGDLHSATLVPGGPWALGRYLF